MGSSLVIVAMNYSIALAGSSRRDERVVSLAFFCPEKRIRIKDQDQDRGAGELSDNMDMDMDMDMDCPSHMCMYMHAGTIHQLHQAK